MRRGTHRVGVDEDTTTTEARVEALSCFYRNVESPKRKVKHDGNIKMCLRFNWWPPTYGGRES